MVAFTENANHGLSPIVTDGTMRFSPIGSHNEQIGLLSQLLFRNCYVEGGDPETQEIVGHTERHIFEVRGVKRCVDDQLQLAAWLEGDD